MLAELASRLRCSSGEQLRVVVWRSLGRSHIVETGSDTNESFHSIYEH